MNTKGICDKCKPGQLLPTNAVLHGFAMISKSCLKVISRNIFHLDHMPECTSKPLSICVTKTNFSWFSLIIVKLKELKHENLDLYN